MASRVMRNILRKRFRSDEFSYKNSQSAGGNKYSTK